MRILVGNASLRDAITCEQADDGTTRGAPYAGPGGSPSPVGVAGNKSGVTIP
jgi:hypothetical protein